MNNRYSGMTVNERLYEAHLMPDFDEAAKRKDKKKMIEILKMVELSDNQASETTEAIIKNPSTYGY